MSKRSLKNVDEYIADCPKEARDHLERMRSAIQGVAPGATERVDYFQMPGYSYEGYDYDGMFAWFSFKEPYVRLHIRPLALQEYAGELAGYRTTKAIVSFPLGKPLPSALIRKLVRASIRAMKGAAPHR